MLHSSKIFLTSGCVVPQHHKPFEYNASFFSLWLHNFESQRAVSMYMGHMNYVK